MWKKSLIAVAAVFIAWTGMDFVIHQRILAETYQKTAELWRPEEEMKLGLLMFVVFCNAALFVGLYAWFVTAKSLQNGLLFGLLFGLAVGLGMGYGTFAVMPIPYSLALGWFLATVAESVVGGLLVGAIVK